MEFQDGQITREVYFEPLPAICEYSEFGSEEEYYQTTEVDNSKLIKTRSGFSTLPLRFEDGEESEEELPLFCSTYTPHSKLCNVKEWKPKLPKGRKVQKRRIYKKVSAVKWKPKLAKGWKMQKRRVRTAWAKSHQCRQSLKSSVKLLSYSPILLLKTIRDAYVSVMTRLEGTCDQRMWYLAGARIV